jgi:hypothetical protein
VVTREGAGQLALLGIRERTLYEDAVKFSHDHADRVRSRQLLADEWQRR